MFLGIKSPHDMRRFHNQQTDAGCTTPAALHFRRAASATVLALLCSSAAWAVPAKPGVMTFDNAAGMKFFDNEVGDYARVPLQPGVYFVQAGADTVKLIVK